MDNACVIAAIPSVGDRAHKASSEPLAHMTMLYLDRAVVESNLENVLLHLQHVADTNWTSGFVVDRRGTLGSDEADVLFFDSKNNKQFAEIRHQLLLNDTIQMAYNRVEQFPSWTPHLTLGYPATPAHELEYEVGWVEFDRLAVLFDNYEGPEFRLSRQNRSDSAVTMSDTMVLGASAAEDVLAHYGVKGMKWGVRKDNGHEGETVKTKHLGKLDKKWEKENTGQRGYFKAHNAMADRMNNGMIDDFNNDPRWKDIDFNDPKNAHHEKTYMDEFFKLSDKVFREEMVKLGSNPSGTKRFELKTDEDGNEYVELVDTKVKHSEGDVKLVFSLKRDKLRHISSLTPEERELKHYGVKGMKWGVRKDESSATSGPQPVVITQKRPGTFAKASGGGGHQMTDDAVNSLSIRQKAKTSTTDSLSNAELKQVVERMQLEQKYAQLLYNSDRRSLGARFAAGFFGYKRYDGNKRRYEDNNERLGEILATTLQKAREPSN